MAGGQGGARRKPGFDSFSFPMGMAAACNVRKGMCACGMRVAWWPTREWGHLLVRGGSRVHRPGVYVCVRPMGRGATAPACVPRVLARATPLPPRYLSIGQNSIRVPVHRDWALPPAYVGVSVPRGERARAGVVLRLQRMTD
jgi:hypothetical protein